MDQPNRSHQNRIVLWQLSIPRSGSNTF